MTGFAHPLRPSKTRRAARKAARNPVDDMTVSPADRILHLQQTIGNRAVQRLLTTTDAPAGESAELLSPPQVARALNFYAAQPQRYTPAIIMDIQFEVGTVPTGRMTAIDVQAVAKRQKAMNDAGEKPELKVDGMAGPRTLPAIFKIGLAKDNELDAFGNEARDLLANQQGKSDEAVALELVKQVNKQLEGLRIPPVKPITNETIGGRGAFRSTNWQLLLDARQFVDPKLRDMKLLTSTIYHESRHAEQHYRIAQMLAGRKKTAEQIERETGIFIDVCKKAVGDPLKPGTMEAVIAEGWNDSLFGAEGLAKRQRNSRELAEAFAAKQAAEKENKENPSPQNEAKEKAARARFERAVAEHDDFPHEFDAERLENQVEKRL